MEIESGDIVQLIVQYCEENNLALTSESIQKETGISLNTLPLDLEVDGFLNHVMTGRWDLVLDVIRKFTLSSKCMLDLYEQITLEMIEAREYDVVKALLYESEPLQRMYQEQESRHERLVHLSNMCKAKKPEEEQDWSMLLYQGKTKAIKRAPIVQQLKLEISERVPASRLLTLLEQALKFQQSKGLLSDSHSHDLLRGTAKRRKVEVEDKCARRKLGRIKFSKTALPQCILFSSDGDMLVSGSKDGFIEVWDVESLKLRKDLPYQAKDEFMMHEHAVTCLAFRDDNQVLASGSSSGQVCLWNTQNGRCIQTFDSAHGQSVSSIRFNSDGTQILTASLDQTIRIRGLKSGSIIKEFRGHKGSVNQAIYTSDESKIVSGSSDGTIMVWDAKRAICLSTFHPPNKSPGAELDVHSIHILPSQSAEDTMLVCNRSNEAHIFTLTGDVIETFKHHDPEKFGDFVDAVNSPHQKYVYLVTEHGRMLAYSKTGGHLEHSVEASSKEFYGIQHHPNRNLVTAFGKEGILVFEA